MSSSGTFSFPRALWELGAGVFPQGKGQPEGTAVGRSLLTRTRDANPAWLVPHREEGLQGRHTLRVLRCCPSGSFIHDPAAPRLWHLPSPPRAQLGLFVPPVPNLSRWGRQGRGFLSNPDHPRTGSSSSSSSPSPRRFGQQSPFSRKRPRSQKHPAPAGTQRVALPRACCQQPGSWCSAAQQRPCLDSSAKSRFPAG